MKEVLGRAGSSFCVGQPPQEGCGFLAPASTIFDGEHNEFATSRLGEVLGMCCVPSHAWSLEQLRRPALVRGC